MLIWRQIASIPLSKTWQFTELSSASIFRVTHTLSASPTGTVRAMIGQSVEGVVFDRRMIGYRAGNEEAQLFVKPNDIDSRFLALQRLDTLDVGWTVKIEELIPLADALPLPISDVEGLQDALNNKATVSELTAIANQINEAIANLQPPSVGDIPGLQDALNSKASTTQLTEAIANLQTQTEDELETGFANLIGLLPKTSIEEPVNPFVGMIWNEINGSGEITETWIRQGTRWVSQCLYSLDFPSPTSSISGSVSYGFPLNTGFDYLFKEFSYFCQYSSGTVDATNFWRCLFTTQPTGQTFADSGAIANTNAASQVVPLNVLFSPAVGERLLLMINKVGAAPGARVGAGLKFRRVRK